MKAIRVPDGKRISNSRLKAPKGDVVAEAVAAGEHHVAWADKGRGSGGASWWRTQDAVSSSSRCADQQMCRAVLIASMLWSFLLQVLLAWRSCVCWLMVPLMLPSPSRRDSLSSRWLTCWLQHKHRR